MIRKKTVISSGAALLMCSCAVLQGPSAPSAKTPEPNAQVVAERNDCPDQPLLTRTLAQRPLRPLKLGAIQPAGWLRNQIQLEAASLCGQLDTFWPSVKDSAWIGGKDDGWERLPYWLDGAVPLAWLSGDKALQQRVTGYINYILTHQDKEGWFGPPQADRQKVDLWANILILKPLLEYYELTGDERVVPAMARALERFNLFLDGGYLYAWGKARWFDILPPTYWLYEKTGDPKLMELAVKVQAGGFNWTSFMQRWPYTRPTPRNGWNLMDHVVNCAMAPREPAFWWRISGEESDRQASLQMIETLVRYHGTVWGGFTGDECVVGKNPIQGSELCSVVEFMDTLEQVAAVTGEPTVADRLEKVAFNALPGTFLPDMWGHQYHQQVNQVQCVTTKEPVFHNSGPQANLYGVEPNYGCCTANMAQGWPKLAAHLWMATQDEGLAAVVYAPCTVKTKVREANVMAKVATEYPFRDRVTITLKTDRPVRFPLNLRIPAWTKDATVKINGRKAGNPTAGTFLKLERKWAGETTIELRFPMPAQAERRYNNALAITRGPLVYSLKIGVERTWVNKELPLSRPPHQDWELRPTTPWNYALDLDERTVEGLPFKENPLGKLPFSPEGAPVEAQAQGARLAAWGLEMGSAATTPLSPVQTDQPVESVTLIPYGCTNLRVTEFPTLR